MDDNINDGVYHSIEWLQEKAIARLGGDKAFAQKLARLFLQDSPALIEEIKLGIKEQAYDVVFVPLHSLKGTCSNFCSEKLEDSCDRMLLQIKSSDWQQAEMGCEQLSEFYWKLDKELCVFVKE